LTRRSSQFEQRDDRIADERLDARPTLAKKTSHVTGAAVTEPNPNDFGRRALQNAEPVEVLVFRDEYGAEFNGALPHDVVSNATETEKADVTRVRRQVLDVRQKSFG
jgi:hypothetical protein